MRWKAALAVLVALILIGAWNDPDRSEPADDRSAAASRSSSAQASSSTAAPRSSSSTPRPPATPPPPPPVTVQPFTFAGAIAEEPARAPLPDLAAAPDPGASLVIGAGWTGGVVAAGPQAPTYIRCALVPPEESGGLVPFLQYEISTDAEFSEFVDPGGFYIQITRYPGRNEAITTKVKVYTKTTGGDRYEMWDSTHPLDATDQLLEVSASADNRRLALSGVGVPVPSNPSVDADTIQWTLMQGTVSCPEALAPLPIS